MLFKNKIQQKKDRAFTLIETLVGVAVFVIIATASYQAYVSLFTLINQNQYKILALNLANEQFEIIRNLAYSDVGIQGGLPNGKIPHSQTLVRAGVTFAVTTTIRNVDIPFDGTIGGTPNDLSPADNKLVELEVDCPACVNFTPVSITTTVAPKALETLSTNGALFVRVFDANGVAVSGASVHIVNTQANPDIIIDDVTDTSGILQIIDAPPGVEAYEITVTKSGYSTDRTYTNGAVGNPDPLKLHATVVLQQVTQVSFAIDKLSNISFSSLTPTCAVVGGVDFSLESNRLVGAGVPKYLQNLTTDGSGTYSNSSMEWGSYTITGTDATYDIVGINPLNPINLNPDSVQEVDLIVATKNPRSLLITVKDASTQLPVTDATVQVTGTSYDETQITDRGFINQTDWSGGVGVDYVADDGFLDIAGGEIKLKNVSGSYNPNGILESSTVDTGSESNFHSLVWSPTDQPVSASSDGTPSVRFQIATNASSTDTIWNYLGPDGTAATYYTSSNAIISSVHNNDRYLRYKVFLHTADPAVTPNISDIAFTMTSSCTPPGQVIFSGLSSGVYDVSVSRSGYTTQLITGVNMSTNWKEQEVILSP
ncbi:MAG: hypothetical protein QG640_394 [Patescibacteria group bacterium]|nr:hypothetical protein [Patescibacteria group bacterium]